MTPANGTSSAARSSRKRSNRPGLIRWRWTAITAPGSVLPDLSHCGDMRLRALVSCHPYVSVLGAVGQYLGICRSLAQLADIYESEHFPSRTADSFDVAFGPVFVGEELEAAGHYRVGRRLLISASRAIPSAASRSSSAKSASTSLLWSL